MFQQNLITNLLGIANVFVEKIENNSSNIEIQLSTQAKEQVCPCCGQTTKYIHDYRTQKIRDIPFQGKEMFLLLHKRRYVCKSCGKRFLEKYDFLPRYRHFTGRVYASVLNALREKISFKDIGKRFSISSASVFRIFEYKIEEKPEMILVGYKKRFTGVPYGEERAKQEEKFATTTRAKQWLLIGASCNYSTDYCNGEWAKERYIEICLPIENK